MEMGNKMGKKSNFKDKLIHFFFEDENGTEERIEEYRAFDNKMKMAFGFIFIVNAVLLIYLFFRGDFDIFNKLEMVSFFITIACGLGALYYDRNRNGA
jgi:hypothetical protein